MRKLVSLILPVVNRYDDVFNFLDSVNKQTHQIFEVIIVDQGKGINQQRLYASSITIHYYHVNFASSSKARNYGLKIAEGEFIGFPDDDCIYQSASLLERVVSFFENNPKENCIVIDRLDHFENEVPVVPIASSVKMFKINKKNFLKKVTGWNFFIRASDTLEKYNENLGISNDIIFGAGEDVDFVIRNFGFDLTLITGIYISHPTLKIFREDQKNRTFKYAVGFGAILKSHYGITAFLTQVSRSGLGLIWSIFKLDYINVIKYKMIIFGVVKGYFLWPR